MKTNERTNIYISAEARAILAALGAAATGKPTMAGGLAELISRVTDGITTHPTQPGRPQATPYRAAWTSAEGEPEETEFAYPTPAEAIAAAVILRFEEARAAALAAQAEADREAAEVAAEQEHNYNAMIGESLRMP